MTKKINKNQLPSETIPFIWNFAKNYKFLLSVALMLTIIFGSFVALTPYTVKIIIDTITNYDGRGNLMHLLTIPVLIYIAVRLISQIIGFIGKNACFQTAITKIQYDIRNEVFKYLEKHSYSYFQNRFSGSVANKINDIAFGAGSIINQLGGQIFFVIVTFLFSLFLLVRVNYIFAVVLVVWSILFNVIIIGFSKKIEKYSRERSNTYSKFFGKVIDVITNILSVKSFANEKFEKIKIANSAKEVVNKENISFGYERKVDVLREVLNISFLGTNLFFLTYLTFKKLISVGDFVFVLTINIDLMWNISWISFLITDFYRNLGNLKNGLGLITVPHLISDKSDAKDIKIKNGEIAFKDVNFGYNEKNVVFKKLNITINPKEKVGLVGLSGAGKSTFVNLIMRYFDINKGEILIDGQNIANVTQGSLRRRIAFIPQDPSLFHRTIEENIKYGNIKASKKAVIKASQKANCEKFINNLPQKYETLVGERGVKLSGGQRQRIAIARALLKDAPIVIFDEATSSLDSITEKNIQDAVKRVMRNKTVIAIAHRLSTLQDMDRILVFDNGRIVEDGSHRQLLAKKGKYAKLWKTQIDGFILKEKEDEEVEK